MLIALSKRCAVKLVKHLLQSGYDVRETYAERGELPVRPVGLGEVLSATVPKGAECVTVALARRSDSEVVVVEVDIYRNRRIPYMYAYVPVATPALAELRHYVKGEDGWRDSAEIPKEVKRALRGCKIKTFPH